MLPQLSLIRWFIIGLLLAAIYTTLIGLKKAKMNIIIANLKSANQNVAPCISNLDLVHNVIIIMSITVNKDTKVFCLASSSH